MSDITAIFGDMVFGDAVMKARLPRDIYHQLRAIIKKGAPLEHETLVASVVASVMKDWAVEKGATHFTHWFQPMTGITVEKHDSFLSRDESGAIIEFSGSALMKGEPDASSFPSGGLRATFEARGYTAWDPSSYAFVKDNTLYIPTVFYAYNGEALDQKTPLLRSMEVLSNQCVRVLRLFGDEVEQVISNVGAEQEYFLIDKSLYDQRPDLRACGRTLLGAPPARKQENDYHYFGAIRPRIKDFMQELDIELWKLGVYAKTEHNETAPGQHELAPIYTSSNVAADHNQLIMELMKTIGERHGMACLLHEKPFMGVNGSGKHNNWSLSTDAGVNLFEPGDSPQLNARFLLFITAVLKSVDEYQDLLRYSVSSPGNDLRLGGHEAPPAIISVCLGNELSHIFECIINEAPYEQREGGFLNIGVDMLPRIPRDTSDRNRTSPMAFTGNKFEFRMVGSSSSVASPNIVLNAIMADTLRIFADKLEQAKNFNNSLSDLIRDTLRKHKRIIFNGNSYTDAWEGEAEELGLLNLRSTPDALPHYLQARNIALFTRLGILSAAEMHSRYEILLQSYCETIGSEAATLLSMLQRDIYPACASYMRSLAEGMVAKRACGVIPSSVMEEGLLFRLSLLSDALYQHGDALAAMLDSIDSGNDLLQNARFYCDEVLPVMNNVREIADELEGIVDRRLWPYPTYDDLLYYRV